MFRKPNHQGLLALPIMSRSGRPDGWGNWKEIVTWIVALLGVLCAAKRKSLIVKLGVVFEDVAARHSSKSQMAQQLLQQKVGALETVL